VVLAWRWCPGAGFGNPPEQTESSGRNEEHGLRIYTWGCLHTTGCISDLNPARSVGRAEQCLGHRISADRHDVDTEVRPREAEIRHTVGRALGGDYLLSELPVILETEHGPAAFGPDAPGIAT